MTANTRPGLGLAAAIGLLLSSCGAAESVVDSALGKFDGQGGAVALIVDQGYSQPETVLLDAESVLAQAADEGSQMSALILDGQSVSGAVPVRFSDDAGMGDFHPAGKSDDAFRDEAAKYSEAAERDLVETLTSMPESDAGADLVGGISRGIALVRNSGTSGPLIVVVSSGGAVHRSGPVDLISIDPAEVVAAAQTAATSLPDPQGITFIIGGVARFVDVEESVDPDFVAVVGQFWSAFCVTLEENGAVSCTAAADLPIDLFALSEEP